MSQHREVHREILSLPDRPYIDVSVSRVLEALVAGTSRMHWGTFAFYSVLGGRRWATAVVYAGYWGTTTPRVGAIRSLGPDCLSPSCPTARGGVELLARLPVGDLPQESIGLS